MRLKCGRAFLGLAFLGFQAFSPTPAIFRSWPGGRNRVESNVSENSQNGRSLPFDKSSAWLTRFSRAGRDFAFLEEPRPGLLVPLGVAAAFATALYYNNIRPHPSECKPTRLEKWQHCFVGCEVSFWCPVGSLSASLLAVLKEIWDIMGHGDFELADVCATLKGTWDCPLWESCEYFCCEQFD